MLATMMSVTGTLTRSQTGRDSAGGVTKTYAQVAANFPCEVQPASASTQMRYSKRDIQVDVTVYFSADIGAQEDDILIVTDNSGNSQKIQCTGYRPGFFGHLESPWQMVGFYLP